MQSHGSTILTERTKMVIRIKRKFVKQYEKAPKNVQVAVDERIVLFRQEPFHPLLHNHRLAGSYQGYRSINITGDWRALYLERRSVTGDIVVEFKLLGTHNQLYR